MMKRMVNMRLISTALLKYEVFSEFVWCERGNINILGHENRYQKLPIPTQRLEQRIIETNNRSIHNISNRELGDGPVKKANERES